MATLTHGTFSPNASDLVLSSPVAVGSPRRATTLGLSWQDRAAWHRRLPDKVAEAFGTSIQFKRLLPGQVFCDVGNQLAGWIGVLDGFVSLDTSELGSGHLSRGLPCGTWFGEEELLTGEPLRYRMVAVAPSLLAVVPKQMFHCLIDEQSTFGRLVLEIQAQRLSAIRRRTTWPRKLGTNATVALQLADLFVPEIMFDGDYCVTLTQYSLSKFVRLSRQRTNEALNHLRRIGEAQLMYGSLRLRNPAALVEQVLAGNIQ